MMHGPFLEDEPYDELTATLFEAYDVLRDALDVALQRKNSWAAAQIMRQLQYLTTIIDDAL
jgi:hypothetical protein